MDNRDNTEHNLVAMVEEAARATGAIGPDWMVTDVVLMAKVLCADPDKAHGSRNPMLFMTEGGMGLVEVLGMLEHASDRVRTDLMNSPTSNEG